MRDDEQYTLPAREGIPVKRWLLIGDDFVLTGFREDKRKEKLS